jgi:hypothetical protein
MIGLNDSGGAVFKGVSLGGYIYFLSKCAIKRCHSANICDHGSVCWRVYLLYDRFH